VAGRPGRSGGWNRLPAEVHALRGTKPRKAPVPEAHVAWLPTEAQLAGLDVAGRAFVDRLLAPYEFSPVEGELLLEAAAIADRLATIRQARDGADLPGRLALERAERLWAKQFSALLLNLRPRS